MSVVLVDGAEGAQGTPDTLPGKIAVLERTALATSLALLLDLGEAPDPAALRSASIIAVEAARPLADTEEPGSVELDFGPFDALTEAREETQRYLGVAAPGGAEAEIVDIVLATPPPVEVAEHYPAATPPEHPGRRAAEATQLSPQSGRRSAYQGHFAL